MNDVASIMCVGVDVVYGHWVVTLSPVNAYVVALATLGSGTPAGAEGAWPDNVQSRGRQLLLVQRTLCSRVMNALITMFLYVPFQFIYNYVETDLENREWVLVRGGGGDG